MRFPFKLGFARRKNYCPGPTPDFDLPNLESLDNKEGISSNRASTVPKESIFSSLEPSHAFGARFAANNSSQVTAATTNETTFKQAQSAQTLKGDGERLANDPEFGKPSQSIEQPAKVSTGKKLKAAVLSYTESARKAIMKKKGEENLANTTTVNFAFENLANSQLSADFIAGDYSGEHASAQREREDGSATCAQSQAPRSHETRSSRATRKGPYTKGKKTGTSRKLRILAAKKRRAKRRTTRSGKLLSRVPKNLEAWEDIKQNVKQPEDEGYDLKFDYNKILKPSFVDGWLNDTVNPLVDALPLSAGQLAQGQIRYAVDFDNDLEEPARECAHCKRDPSGASGLGNCDTCYYFMKSERTEFLKYGDAKKMKREFDAHASCPFMSSDVEDSFASTGDSMLGICLMPILGVWDKVDRKLFHAKTRFRQFTESVPVWSQNVRAAANSGYGWRSLRPTKCGPQPKNWGDLLPQEFPPRYDEFWPQDLGPADFYKVSVDFAPKPAAPRLVQGHQSEPPTSKKPVSHCSEAKQSFEVEEFFVDAVHDTPASVLKVSSSFNDVGNVSSRPPVEETASEPNQHSVEIEYAFKNESCHQNSSFSNGNSGFDFFSGAFATGNPNDEWAAAEVVSVFEHTASQADETTVTPLEKIDVKFYSDALLTVSPELSTAIPESAGNSAGDNEFKVLVSACEVDAEFAESVVTQSNSIDSIEKPETSYLVSSTVLEENFIDTQHVGCVNSSSSDVSVFEPMEPVHQPLEAISSGRAEERFEAFFNFTESKCLSSESTIGRSTPVISEVPSLQLPVTQSFRTENISDFVSQGTLRSNADVIREIDEMLRGLGYDSTVNSGLDSTVTDPCSPLVLPSPTWDLGLGNEPVENSQVLTSEDEEVLEEIYTRNPDNKGNPHSIGNLTEALVAEIIDQYNKGKFDQPRDPNASAEILGALLDEVFRGAQGLSEEFISRHKEDFVETQSEHIYSSDNDDSHRFTVLSDSDEEKSVSYDSEREILEEEPIDVGCESENQVPVLRELRLVRKTIASKDSGKECQVVSFTRLNSSCRDTEDYQPILKQLRLATRCSGVLSSSNLFVPLRILGSVVETDFTPNESLPKLQPVICVPKSCPQFVRRAESVKIVSSRFHGVVLASHVQSTLTQQRFLPAFHGPHATLNEPEVTYNSVREQRHSQTSQDFEVSEEGSRDPVICKGNETASEDGQPKQEESLWVSLSMDQDFDRTVISGSGCVEEDLDILRTAKENMPRMTELFRMAVDVANLETSSETGEKLKARVQFKNDENISETQAFDKNTAPSEVSRSKETLNYKTESLLRNSASSGNDDNLWVKNFSQPHTEEERKETEMELWAKIEECKESLSKQLGDSEKFEVQNSFVQFLEAFKLSREHFAELATSQVFEYSNWLIQIKGAISGAFALTNGAGNQYSVFLEFIDQERKSEKSMRQLDSDIRDTFGTLGKINDMLDQVQSAILVLRFEFPDYVGIMAKIFGTAVRSCDELLQIYAKFCLVNVNDTFDTESIHYCTGYKIFLEKTAFVESNRDTDYEFKFATYLNQLQKSHDVVNTAKTELERRLQIISMSLANNRFLSESHKLFEKRLSQETIISRSDLSLSGKTLTGSTEDVSVADSETKTEKAKSKKKMAVPGWMKFKGFGKKR